MLALKGSPEAMVDEIKRGDKVKDVNGRMFKVVSVDKEGVLTLTAKGVVSKASIHEVAKIPSGK